MHPNTFYSYSIYDIERGNNRASREGESTLVDQQKSVYKKLLCAKLTSVCAVRVLLVIIRWRPTYGHSSGFWLLNLHAENVSNTQLW